MIGTIEKVLILNFLELPKEIQRVVKEWNGFANDAYLKLLSEFEPNGKSHKTYSETLTDQSLKAYWNNQRSDGNTQSKTVSEFIKEYGLEFEQWLLDNKIDLTISKIFVNISW